jgi:ribosomal protein L7/L12
MPIKVNFPAQQPATVSFESLCIGDGFFTADGRLGLKTSWTASGDNCLVIDRHGAASPITFHDTELVQPAEIEISVTAKAPPPVVDLELNIAERELVRLQVDGTCSSGRIHAIRAYRERVGCGLKEAKDKTDEYMEQLQNIKPHMEGK